MPQRSVRTISTYLPVAKDLEEPLRAALIKKYKTEVIGNVVDMRLVAKIARSVRRGAPERTVISALRRLVEDPSSTLDDAYTKVAWVYDVRALATQAKSLTELINELGTSADGIDEPTWRVLRDLHKGLTELLRGR